MPEPAIFAWLRLGVCPFSTGKNRAIFLNRVEHLPQLLGKLVLMQLPTIHLTHIFAGDTP